MNMSNPVQKLLIFGRKLTVEVKKVTGISLNYDVTKRASDNVEYTKNMNKSISNLQKKEKAVVYEKMKEFQINDGKKRDLLINKSTGRNFRQFL